MRNEELGAVFRFGGGFAFFGWERIARFAWIRGTRGRSVCEWGDLRGVLKIQE